MEIGKGQQSFRIIASGKEAMALDPKTEANIAVSLLRGEIMKTPLAEMQKLSDDLAQRTGTDATLMWEVIRKVLKEIVNSEFGPFGKPLTVG